MKTFLSFFIFLFIPILIIGQTDSVVLTADKLLLKDIRPAEITEIDQQVTAATRSSMSLKNLPFTVHVITKEEIRNNGYRTLVDALKMAPGIKISQPGNALEGETFLMRGLVGNTYAKILLNGNPIKPVAVRGMPIGAQLPIQQAERIEVIYGAQGTLYGSDASSGIINIVLEETQRPVYTQANLSVGNNEYTNLDVSFGGRLGKQKNTLRYSLFGSYTFQGDLNTQHANDSLFNPESYQTGILEYQNLQNYVTFNGLPIINELPHQSRMVGVNLAFRSMTLSVESMYRRDHSSIGLNPVAVSYANPLNYLGERILNANFSIKKRYRKFGFEFRTNYLQYRMDNRSSTNYIYNTSNRFLDSLTWADNFNPITNILDQSAYDSLSNQYTQRYFDGTRFSISESHNLYIDWILDFFPTKNLALKLGTTIRTSSSVPLVNYSQVPLGFKFLTSRTFATETRLTPFFRRETGNGQVNTFGQAIWSLKKWTIIGNVQWLNNNFFRSILTTNDIKITSTDFRLGIIYQLNPRLSIRGNYGSAVQIPSPYYQANSFVISSGGRDPINLSPINLKEEKTTSVEVGIRWTPSKELYFDIIGFYNHMLNPISYFQRAEYFFDNLPELYFQGYANSGDSELTLYGLQSNYLYKSKLFDFGFNLTLSYGSEKLFGQAEQNRVSEQPKMIRKTRISFKPTQRISFTFDTVVNGKSMDRLHRFGRTELPRIRTIDVLGNYNINRNFRVFFKVKNVFNREYPGLNAYGNVDGLLYNPQEKRNFRLGMSYRVD